MANVHTVGRRFDAGAILIALLALAVLAEVVHPFVTVGAGERAVIFSLHGGTLPVVYGEGTHFIVPFIQRPVFYDVRTQTYTMSAVSWEGEVRGDDSLSALTSDGQVIKLDVSIRFHPDPREIYRLHKRIGPDYVDKVIRPEARSQVRIIIAQYPINDVYSAKREEIAARITDRMRADLAANDIVLDEVLLRDIQFSPEFAAVIEQKQIAQQNAQRMQYVLLTAEKQKQQKILEAEGDATSIQLRGQAIAQSSRVVQYEYARKIAPTVSTIVTDGQASALPFGAGSPVGTH